MPGRPSTSYVIRRPSGWRFLLVLLGCAATLQLLHGQAAQSTHDVAGDNVHSVYPFLGVDWGGNAFVGAAIPFGMVKLGPDMEDFDGRPSGFGYLSGGRILGFSHLHLSGASGKYGNILVAPATGALGLADIKSPRVDEVNHPGYYAATLTRYNVRAELTATRRVGFHRYTFPASRQSHLIVDIAHCLDKGPGSESQRFLGGRVNLLSDHEAEGVGRYAGGWNKGGEYRVYFYIVLDTPASSAQTWSGETLTSAKDASVVEDRPLGSVFNLHTHAGQVVQAKVGISFISAEQARQNVLQEVLGWDFDAVRNAAVKAWNEALSRIQIHGETDSKRVQFYTAMYHTMLMPSDRTGENPGWNRASHTTTTTTQSGTSSAAPAPAHPNRSGAAAGPIRSLIDIYRHRVSMPDARSGN